MRHEFHEFARTSKTRYDGPKAFTQRAQIVGCWGFDPTSVSQCQQRSHFWPAALVTETVTGPSPSGLISSWETFNSSRRDST